jgi:hypothetical protein
LKFLSVRSIVSPEARTGRDTSRSTAVITTAQQNSVTFAYDIPLVRMFMKVTMKLIEPSSDEIPAM